MNSPCPARSPCPWLPLGIDPEQLRSRTTLPCYESLTQERCPERLVSSHNSCPPKQLLRSGVLSQSSAPHTRLQVVSWTRLFDTPSYCTEL